MTSTAGPHRPSVARRIAVGLCGVLALTLVADFVAAAATEYRVSRLLRQDLALDSDPEVRIGGFPFATQAFHGQFGNITLRVPGAPSPGLKEVTVVAGLRDVRLSTSDVLGGRATAIVAGRAEVSERVTATDLGQFLTIPNLQIIAQAADPKDGSGGSGGSGIITDRGFVLLGTLDLGIVKAEVAVNATLDLAPGGVRVIATSMAYHLPGIPRAEQPEFVQTAALERFSAFVPLPVLPFGIAPTRARALGSELVIEGSGTDVAVRGNPPGN